MYSGSYSNYFPCPEYQQQAMSTFLKNLYQENMHFTFQKNSYFFLFGEKKSTSFWYFSGVIFYNFYMILFCSKVPFNFIKPKKK